MNVSFYIKYVESSLVDITMRSTMIEDPGVYPSFKNRLFCLDKIATISLLAQDSCRLYICPHHS